MMSELNFPAPCMVCGIPTEMCCPLTICKKCRDTPKAEDIRKRLKKRFEEAKKK